ncbi:MAG TPA: hypothetical protein VN829_20965 [Dongiaceae bacterium]|nr:hypothetical protein [Dongiaceae bacterium]
MKAKHRKPVPSHLRAVDSPEFKRFTKVRAAWVKALRGMREAVEAHGLDWKSVVEDV